MSWLGGRAGLARHPLVSTTGPKSFNQTHSVEHICVSRGGNEARSSGLLWAQAAGQQALTEPGAGVGDGGPSGQSLLPSCVRPYLPTVTGLQVQPVAGSPPCWWGPRRGGEEPPLSPLSIPPWILRLSRDKSRRSETSTGEPRPEPCLREAAACPRLPSLPESQVSLFPAASLLGLQTTRPASPLPPGSRALGPGDFPSLPVHRWGTRDRARCHPRPRASVSAGHHHSTPGGPHCPPWGREWTPKALRGGFCVGTCLHLLGLP